ncbi:MAG: hypothetical protein Q8N74_03860 [Sulfuricella sp.]|nr:hypothetical protein [Sulfuricella sp.]
MNPQDFLQTAKNLSGSQYEADMRSAISRAYYAALHTAFSALPEQRKPDLKARDKSSHSKVIDAYDGWSKTIEPKRTDKRLIKEMLIDIKSQRTRADYELDTIIKKDDVSDSLAQANKVIALAIAL